MKRNLSILAVAACLLGAAWTPSMALAAGQPMSGSSYVNADGSYPAYWAFSRDLDGVPCGIECSRNLAAERQPSFFALAPHHLKRQ